MKGEKLISALMAVILTLAPIVSAAYTLGDYPTFLFKDHTLDAYVVVGADAQPADVVGAVDLAVRLAGESYEVVSAAGGKTYAGAVDEEIPLGEVIAGGAKLDTTLKKYKLPGLQDTTVSFQDETYDVHDEIRLSSTPGDLNVETSLSANDDNYKTNVYLETKRGSMSYYYVFDETIYVNESTSDEPLEIEFLGNTLTITSVSSDSSFTARIGKEYTLNVGDSVTVEGKKVTLRNVGSSGTTAVVDVDGVVSSVSTTTKTINGLKVQVRDTFYSETLSERMATLLLGTETTKTYKDGDPYIGEDKNNPNWVWVISGLTTDKPTIGVKNDFIKDDYQDNPVTLGECYVFPNNYAKVCLEDLTVKAYQTYEMSIEDGVDLSDAGGSWSTVTSASVIKITSPGEDEGLLVSLGGHRTDTVYLYLNTTSGVGELSVFYVDSDNDVKLAGTITLGSATYKEFAQVNFQDTKATDLVFDVRNETVARDKISIRLNNTVVSGDNIITTWTASSLGAASDDSEPDELVWNGRQIGTKDKDLMSLYGTIIRNPDTNGASDRVVLEVPGDQVKAVVVVYGPGGAASATEGGAIKKVVPITTAVAKLDTEISNPATVGKHLVLVGGPAVNRLSAQAMGLSYPTYGSSGLLPFGEGEGYIALYDGVFKSGQVVLVVAGWEADNTRMATSLLQQYSTFADELGSNTAVKVTSLSSSGITPA